MSTQTLTQIAEQQSRRARRQQAARFVRALFSRKIVLVSAIIVVLIIIAAVGAPLFTKFDPYKASFRELLLPPSGEHWLGTDNYGRDLFTRILYGGRVSLLVGVLAVLISCALGTLLGMVAGYFGGVVDAVIMRACEAVRAVPQVVFAMALVAVIGHDVGKLAFILGISNIPFYTRTMRAQTLSVKKSEYVLSAELQGCPTLKLLYKHIFPNCLSPIIVQMTQNVGTTILTESGLSFLGLGVSIPMASWGCMVSDGKDWLLQNPTFALAPGLCIALLVISLNILGDGIRDALDPRFRGEM